MATLADFERLFGGTRQKTAWGNLIQTTHPYAAENRNYYGGAGLIYLGQDYGGLGGGDPNAQPIGASFAQLDPYLAGASKHGQWRDLQQTLNQRLNEVIGFSVDAYTEMQSIYDQINKANGGPFKLNSEIADSSYAFNADAYRSARRAALEAGLQTHAQSRARYDNLVTQFNNIYSGAIKKRDADAAAHAQRLAELDQQRQAAEAAAARSRVWQSNMAVQNRQNENLPDTITAGTADSVDGGGDVGGDVGGKPRRRRGSLSSNLGINA